MWQLRIRLYTFLVFSGCAAYLVNTVDTENIRIALGFGLDIAAIAMIEWVCRTWIPAFLNEIRARCAGERTSQIASREDHEPDAAAAHGSWQS
jgi:hypothetical protein